MNITKENTVYCDALKIELATTDINTGYKPDNCMYMRTVATYLLAVIKSPDIKIKNDIGKIFLGHNIIDYTFLRGEPDIDHLYKTIAYSSLYKSSGIKDDLIKTEDVTVTLISQHIPQQLFDRLKELGIVAEKTEKGIYQIKGSMLFNTHVIVSSITQFN